MIINKIDFEVTELTQALNGTPHELLPSYELLYKYPSRDTYYPSWLLTAEKKDKIIALQVLNCKEEDIPKRIKEKDYYTIIATHASESDVFFIFLQESGYCFCTDEWEDKIEGTSTGLKFTLDDFIKGKADDYTLDIFNTYVNPNLKDPVVEGTPEAIPVEFTQGSEEDLERICQAGLHLFSGLYNAKLESVELQVRGASEEESAEYYFTLRGDNIDPHYGDTAYGYAIQDVYLKKLFKIIEDNFEFTGGSYEYNDGAHYRKSGYSLVAPSYTFKLNQEDAVIGIEEAQRTLKEWLKGKVTPSEIKHLINCPGWVKFKNNKTKLTPVSEPKTMVTKLELL